MSDGDMMETIAENTTRLDRPLRTPVAVRMRLYDSGELYFVEEQ